MTVGGFDEEGHATIFHVPQMLVVDVATQLNATVENKANAQSPPAGVLETVTPMSLDALAIPRGRVFAELWVTDSANTPMQCLWRGYLRTTGDMVAGPSSVPGIFLYPGWRLQANATQTGQGAPMRVGFHCHVQTDPTEARNTNGGFIWSEEPGSGRGEAVTVTVANPAAGADWSVTVPNRERWSLKFLRERLISSAAVANRFPGVQVTPNSNLAMYARTANAMSASRTEDFTWGATLPDQAEPAAGTARTVPLPQTDAFLEAGTQVASSTDNLQAADQWTGVALVVEKWAVPA
jgi:hypothetical protein